MPSRPAATARVRRRPAAAEPPVVQVRAVRRSDLPQVIALDATVTGVEKQPYWRRVYRRYGIGGKDQRHFLVAVTGKRIVGFLIGEVRDWEFGSPPCGWVFAIDVDPSMRQAGIGTKMLQSISALFRRAGVTKLRTLLASDNVLILSFFRSQGMTAGSLIPLEMSLA